MRTNGIANIIVLSQVLKLMAILLKALQMGLKAKMVSTGILMHYISFAAINSLIVAGFVLWS